MERTSPAADEVHVALEGHPLRGTGPFLWTFRLGMLGLLGMAFYLGGPLVRVAAVAGAVFALLGDRAGALRQCLYLGGLAGLIALTPTLIGPLGRTASQVFSVNGPVGMVIGLGAAVLATFVITGVVGALLTRRLHRNRYLYVLNRTGGYLLGVAEGGMLAAALCWVLVLLGPSMNLYSSRAAERIPAIARLLGRIDQACTALLEDPAAAWVAKANPLPKVPAVATMVAAIEAVGDREAFWKAYEEGEFDPLLEEPAVARHIKAFRADPDLQQAAREYDVEKLLCSAQFSAAVADREFCAAVAKHWPTVRARVSTVQLQQARKLADQLGGEAQVRYEQAVRRARQFGVEVP